MDVARDTDATLVTWVRHGPRVAQRLLSVLGARGHAVREFRYHGEDMDGRGLVLLSVAGVDDPGRLARQLERLVDVLSCEPLDVALGRSGQAVPAYVERVDVRVRGSDQGRRACEALVAVRIAGQRQLGVGEGRSESEALLGAFAALPTVESWGGPVHPEITSGWLGEGGTPRAYAWALLRSGERRFEALRVGSSLVAAMVDALAVTYGEMLALPSGTGSRDEPVALAATSPDRSC